MMKLSLKKILPQTLFGRSLLILVTPIFLIQVISTFVFFDNHWEKITARLVFALAGEIAIIAGEIEQSDGPEDIKRISRYAVQHLDLLVSYDEGAKLDLTTEDSRGKSLLAASLGDALDRQVRRQFRIDADVHEKWVEISIQLEEDGPDGKDKGVLNISSPQRRLFSSSAYIFLLWIVGSSIILLAIAVIFMRNQIRPIRRLAIAAERFGKGQNVSSRFKPEGAYEVRQAAQAFLDMHERIKRQISQRTTMLAGISHDLRTPLTRMKLQVSMLGDSPDVDALKADIDDMEKMINAYLEFVRGEGGEQAERKGLRPIMERLVMGAKRQGSNVYLDMTSDIDNEDFLLSLRPISFERCINNIISNARKYAQNVWVSVKDQDDGVIIAVEDDGPGIPPDQYEEVFRPFYRGEPSRNPATGGVGLGLPISQDIVHSHGGKIWLEPSSHGGLRVVIHLPH